MAFRSGVGLFRLDVLPLGGQVPRVVGSGEAVRAGKGSGWGGQELRGARGMGKGVPTSVPTWPVADRRAVLTSHLATPVLAFGSWPYAAPTPSPIPRFRA